METNKDYNKQIFEDGIFNYDSVNPFVEGVAVYNGRNLLESDIIEGIKLHNKKIKFDHFKGYETLIIHDYDNGTRTTGLIKWACVLDYENKLKK